MKNMKLEALEAMMGEDKPMTEAHEATCPKCGHTWTMGEDDDYDEED
jgi:uncharacterized paraquat-inducible protein A